MALSRTPLTRTTPIGRSKPMKRTTMKRGGKIKPKQRSASEYARIYGSKARVEWVKAQPCAWCLLRGLIRIPRPSDNAHTENGGMGRKAGYHTIVPLCRRHHRDYDEHREPFDRPVPRAAIALLAEQTHNRWQALCATPGAR